MFGKRPPNPRGGGLSGGSHCCLVNKATKTVRATVRPVARPSALRPLRGQRGGGGRGFGR